MSLHIEGTYHYYCSYLKYIMCSIQPLNVLDHLWPSCQCLSVGGPSRSGHDWLKWTNESKDLFWLYESKRSESINRTELPITSSWSIGDGVIAKAVVKILPTKLLISLQCVCVCVWVFLTIIIFNAMWMWGWRCEDDDDEEENIAVLTVISFNSYFVLSCHQFLWCGLRSP